MTHHFSHIVAFYHRRYEQRRMAARWKKLQAYRELNGGDPLVTRRNLMSGQEYEESAFTPVYCSPAFESYWSM